MGRSQNAAHVQRNEARGGGEFPGLWAVLSQSEAPARLAKRAGSERGPWLPLSAEKIRGALVKIPFASEYVLFYPVGFEDNLSLLDFCFQGA